MHLHNSLLIQNPSLYIDEGKAEQLQIQKQSVTADSMFQK